MPMNSARPALLSILLATLLGLIISGEALADSTDSEPLDSESVALAQRFTKDLADKSPIELFESWAMPLIWHLENFDCSDPWHEQHFDEQMRGELRSARELMREMERGEVPENLFSSVEFEKGIRTEVRTFKQGDTIIYESNIGQFGGRGTRPAFQCKVLNDLTFTRVGYAVSYIGETGERESGGSTTIFARSALDGQWHRSTLFPPLPGGG